MPRPTRIVVSREPGISEAAGKYYKGQRAEQIVAERVAVKEAEQAAKKAARGTRTSNPRVRTPSQQLKRLERALVRRKTVAARVRIQAQIDALREELER